MHTKKAASITLILLIIPLTTAFQGGNGTDSNPYQIGNLEQLNQTRENLSAHYELVSDINASETENWNEGSGWKSIGGKYNGFTGVFDGKDHEIEGLFINRDTVDRSGLFGELNNPGVVKNVGLTDVNLTAPNARLGGLAGRIRQANVSNSYVTGVINGTFQVGGLTGNMNEGVVSNSYTETNVSGKRFIGGFVGNYYEGTISKSYSRSNVSGNRDVGGFVGEATIGNISNSFSEGRVSGINATGGFTGRTYGGHTTNSYSKANVSGNNSIGGFIGENDGGTFSKSYSTGLVSGKNNTGGFMGKNLSGTSSSNYWDSDSSNKSNSAAGTALETWQMQGANASSNMQEFDFTEHWGITEDYPQLSWMKNGSGTKEDPYKISDCYEFQSTKNNLDAHYELTNDIDCSMTSRWNDGAGFRPLKLAYPNYFDGSFDGRNHKIEDLYMNYTGNSQYIGPFGIVRGNISNVKMKNIEIRSSKAIVGGLAGELERGNIANSSTTGIITAPRTVGGLVGLMYGDPSVTNSHSTAEVIATSESRGDAGGLVGTQNSGLISNSYATGKVHGGYPNPNQGDNTYGGLVGGAGGKIVDSYATGDVKGGLKVGGLAGEAYGTILNSYATGNIEGNTDVGGLAGGVIYDGVVNSSYANASVTGNDTVGGFAGVVDGEHVWDSYSSSEVSGNYSVGGFTGSTDVSSISGTGKINDSYWDVNVSGIDNTSGSATGLYTSEMQGANASSNMQGLDFVGSWGITKDYPQLSWMKNGSGTEEDPYKISNCYQLQATGNTLDDHYRVTEDIDCSMTENWNDGKGFDPIGDGSAAFTGSLDGNGYVVSGLNVDYVDNDFVGLFALMGAGSSVQDIGLEDVYISGRQPIGGLAGSIEETSISNVYVTGEVTSGDAGKMSNVGGLVGDNYNGVISDSYTNVDVYGNTYVGGLVGYQWGNGGTKVSDSYAVSSVTGNDSVGGLIGSNSNGNISGSYATGSVSGENDVGGLVGDGGYGNVVSSYATGDVSGVQRVGGLIGGTNGNTSNSYAAGSVSGTSSVGGFIGSNNGAVSDSYWDSTVGPSSSSGSATGLTTSEMQGANASSNMQGLDFTEHWGITEDYPQLSWMKNGTGTEKDPYKISNCYQLQSMRNSKSSHFALTEDIDCSMTENWNNGSGYIPPGTRHVGERFTGNFDGNGYIVDELYMNRPNEPYQGLISYLDTGSVVKDVGVTNVNITGDYRVAGIVGYIYEGHVNNVFVTGTIVGDNTVGGIVGRILGDDTLINNSYTNATIRGTNEEFGDVAGIIGQHSNGNITNTYSVSDVSSKAGSDTAALIGDSSGGNMMDAYWDKEASNVSKAVGNYDTSDTEIINTTQLNTSEMQSHHAKFNMTKLDFENTWCFRRGNYPGLEVFEDCNLDVEKNSEAPAGSLWIESGDLHWAEGNYELWINDSETVEHNSSAPVGSFWMEDGSIHWVDGNSTERSYTGVSETEGLSDSSGSIWIENGYFRYISSGGNEVVAGSN